MDRDLAAIHEAGHSVVQWIVGWEVRGMEMKVTGSEATSPISHCPHPTLETTSAIRKRLVVLLAGHEATKRRWPDKFNNWGDWNRAVQALQAHFQRPNGIQWFIEDGMSLRDKEANDVLQTALAKCDELVAHVAVSNAIGIVGATFGKATCDMDGTVRISGQDIISICEKEIGEAFRLQNQWSAWFNGN